MTSIRLNQLSDDLDDLDEWIDEGSGQGKNNYSTHESKSASKFENTEDWESFFENDHIDQDNKRNYSRVVEDKLNMRRLKRELYDDTES
jgi:hypothetical protein